MITTEQQVLLKPYILDHRDVLAFDDIKDVVANDIDNDHNRGCDKRQKFEFSLSEETVIAVEQTEH